MVSIAPVDVQTLKLLLTGVNGHRFPDADGVAQNKAFATLCRFDRTHGKSNSTNAQSFQKVSHRITNWTVQKHAAKGVDRTQLGI
jgi:hypothetical protein